MDNQAVIYHYTINGQPPKKTGVANINQTLAHAGVTSRTTLIKWEREGRFPKRVSLGSGRVGWLWSDLYAWSDGLQAKEGGENGQ